MNRKQKVAVVVAILLALTACGGQDAPPDPRMALVGTYTERVEDRVDRLLTRDRHILDEWMEGRRLLTDWDGAYEDAAWEVAEKGHGQEHMVLSLEADGTCTLEVQGVIEGSKHLKTFHGTWEVGEQGPILDISGMVYALSGQEEPFELHAELRHEDGALTHDMMRDPLHRVD